MIIISSIKKTSYPQITSIAKGINRTNSLHSQLYYTFRLILPKIYGPSIVYTFSRFLLYSRNILPILTHIDCFFTTILCHFITVNFYVCKKGGIQRNKTFCLLYVCKYNFSQKQKPKIALHKVTNFDHYPCYYCVLKKQPDQYEFLDLSDVNDDERTRLSTALQPINAVSSAQLNNDVNQSVTAGIQFAPQYEYIQSNLNWPAVPYGKLRFVNFFFRYFFLPF